MVKGINKGKKNGNYNEGITEKFIKLKQENNCKICNSISRLHIHHIDKNEKNNKNENLVILCNQCHNNIHQRGYNFRKTEWFINMSENFTGIQGEGPSVGTPCHFIRLFGCNLQCKWCDSDYSKTGESFKWSYKDVIQHLKKLKKSGIDRIVITGGEPFLQNVVPLLMLCKIFDFKVEIETNGTIPACNGHSETLKEKIYHKSLVEIFNVSPKLKGTQIIPKHLLFRRTLETGNLIQFKDFNYCFKFVVSNEKDIKQIKLIQKRCNIQNDKIFLMPEGALRTTQLKRMPKIIDYCLKYNYKFSPRLHVLAFDDKRGV